MTNNYIYNIFLDSKKNCEQMRNVYDAAIAPVKAFTPYCVAGPSQLVITGVTMESATVIRQ